MFNPESQPIVIVGSHRSGTSALTERLAALGLFVGARLDSHSESTFFQRINRSLSSEAGGHWTTPQVVAESIDGIEDLEPFTAPLRALLDGPGSAEYWGVKRTSTSRPTTWGWKDPRNTYLLPIWQTIFPNLRIISIQRDPRACALSLHRRTDEIRRRASDQAGSSDERTSRRRRLGAQMRWLRGRPILADGWRTLDISRAIDVALAYRTIQLGLTHRPDVLVVDYERLVAAPTSVLGEAADFCGLHPSSEQLAQQAATIVAPDNSGRVHALPLTDEQHCRLLALGYGASKSEDVCHPVSTVAPSLHLDGAVDERPEAER